MQNIEIPHKNKSLFLFHINACSLNKTFDYLQHLSYIEKDFNIIAISKTRITKQISLLNNLNLSTYSFELIPTETYAGCIFLYIANHLSYKCRNNLNIYKNEPKSILLKFSTQKIKYYCRSHLQTSNYRPCWL